MPNTEKSFYLVTTPDPHIARRKTILGKHPEMRRLFGPNPNSALLIAALVSLQLGLAWMLRDQHWLVVLLVSYVGGAYASASLYALIHETSHNLVFRSKAMNRTAGIIANIPLVTIGSETFRRYHNHHHFKMGDYRMDVGIPTEWEARWVGNSPLRKVMWLAFFIFFQLGRTRKFNTRQKFIDKWMMLNIAAMLLADGVIAYFMGFSALLYLFLCFFFSFGFHSLGARVIQEHFMLEEGQETNNFTGKTNILECNFGCHNEHHDFPHVPWNRLPKVSRIAPEFYAPLRRHASRWKLIYTFVTSPEWDLYRHTVRAK